MGKDNAERPYRTFLWFNLFWDGNRTNGKRKKLNDTQGQCQCFQNYVHHNRGLRIVIRYKKTKINLKFKIKPNEELSWQIGVSEMFTISWFPHSVWKIIIIIGLKFHYSTDNEKVKNHHFYSTAVHAIWNCHEYIRFIRNGRSISSLSFHFQIANRKLFNLIIEQQQ